MKKRTKANPFGAGRPKLPVGEGLTKREVVMLRPHEQKIVVEAAKPYGSRSELLRAGLRALGVQIDPPDPKNPG